jgi:hypothetical protein
VFDDPRHSSWAMTKIPSFSGRSVDRFAAAFFFWLIDDWEIVCDGESAVGFAGEICNVMQCSFCFLVPLSLSRSFFFFFFFCPFS